MSQQDTFYLIASISLVVITATIVYVAYYVVNTLKLAQSNLELTEDTLKDVKAAKDGIKSGIGGILMLLANSMQGGGEDNGQK